MTRFEPATSGSTDRRSNQLSYIHHKSVLYFTKLQVALATAPIFFSPHIHPKIAADKFHKSRVQSAQIYVE